MSKADNNNPIQILVIGPCSSGKTILIKSLVHFYNTKFLQMWNFGDVPSHMPTVGVDMTTLNLSQKHNLIVELKELGGQMAPIWPGYFQGIRGLMFVVDSSDPFSWAEASVELARCFKRPDLQKCYFLIVFTKSDITLEDIYSGHYCANAMLLDPILEEKPPGSHVEVVHDCSGLNCTNLQKILHWIERLAYLPLSDS